MNWSWSFAVEILPDLLEHFLKYTLVATVLGTAVAAVLGLVFAMIRFVRIPVLAQATTAFIEFVRSTPLLIQLFFLFYALPGMGLTLSPMFVGVLGLGVHYACYMADVYRSGIDAVPKGQWEASVALQLPPRTTWQRVVLPQAVRNVLPALGNYAIAMFKETPFLAFITVPELLHTARDIGGDTFRYLEPFTMAGLVFLAASYPTALLLRRLEGRLAAY
ncbi:ectoine/hydroxyectoine ABC transporter permease subunit EhuD [Prauserella muralis]|uniref:Ectoine/hydroxyectoine ABC transporter permease subunit EhuD n=1 Tax=Prauserella muralis TaxID=588067 RepID=A0A2V4AKW7_9PSEU|nr:ectoine/hydroxyectoine ABC transporter permease subunit EhuD [Prauserella muralis]PXY20948.1 ectoine/hydroxyectoine ABC transporter permease subunit EhuD [Prauserella muralis]TWE30009.1 amino acid ABC transporter membrane protein 2 (PAAT family) [Prauserella muralis]